MRPNDDESTIGDPSEDLVPGYTILGQLGAGGMGTVHLASHPRYGHVALKVRRRVGHPDLARRFERECAALASMDLPGVVPLLDTGSTSEVDWFAMRWVRGPSLQDAVRQGGPLSESEAVRIAISVAETLHQVHTAGLAHRDLKPSNILLEPTGEPILVDFGILRHLDPLAHTELTRQPMGTPAYMAPEVLKTHDVDWVRADLYALAVVLAWCIRGDHPRGPWDLEEASAPLRAVLERAMDPRPSNRFGSLDAFAKALRSTSRRQVRWGAVALVGLVACVAVLGWWMTSRTVPPLDFAPVESLLAADREEEAYGVLQRLLNGATLEQANQLWLRWASTQSTPESWARAWSTTEGRAKQLAFEGLVRALSEVEAYDALTRLLGDPSFDAADPDGSITFRTHLYNWNFEAAREQAPPGLLPFLEHLERDAPLQPAARVSDAGWTCFDRSCEHVDGRVRSFDRRFIHVHGATITDYAYTDDALVSLETGKRCPTAANGRAFAGAGWNGQVMLATSGVDRLLRSLDPTTCALTSWPDVELWTRSFVNGVVAWNVDEDPAEELAVIVGAAHQYAIWLYDDDGTLIDRLKVGEAYHAQIVDDAVVFVTAPPHGSGVLFDLPPVGAHRVQFVNGSLELVESWPGQWDEIDAFDPSGDGRSILTLWDGEHLRLAFPGVEGTFALRGSPLSMEPRASEPPTGDDVLDAAHRMETLGLPGIGAEILGIEANLASPKRRVQLLRETARLASAAENVEVALEARRRLIPIDGSDPAIALALLHGAFDEALAFDAEHPATAPELRAALDNAWVETFDDRPTALSFDPDFTRWNRDAGEVQILATGSPGEIGRMGLRETSPYRGLELTFRVDRLEHGSVLTTHLVGPKGDVVQPTLRAHGSRGAEFRGFYPEYDGERLLPDLDPRGSHEAVVRIALHGDEIRFQWVDDGVVRFDETVPGGPEAVIEHLSVAILSRDGALADVAIQEMRAWGLERYDSPMVPSQTPRRERAHLLTQLRTSIGLERLSPADPEHIEATLDAYLLTWDVHRGLSGLEQRILAIPGADDPAVWGVNPYMGMLRAEVLLASGRPVEALEVLDNTPGACLTNAVLTLVAYQALHRDSASVRARILECGESESQVRTSLWRAGVSL